MSDILRTIEVNTKFIDGLFKSIKVQEYDTEFVVINRKGNAYAIPKNKVAIFDIHTLANLVANLDEGLSL